MSANFSRGGMEDHVMWFIMKHNDETFIEDAVRALGLPTTKLQSLYRLAQNVIDAPDKNALHRRIYSGAMANRLEGE